MFSWGMGGFEARSSCQISYGVYSCLVPRTYLCRCCIIPHVLGLVTGIYDFLLRYPSLAGHITLLDGDFRVLFVYVMSFMFMSPVLFWDIGCYESGTCP